MKEEAKQNDPAKNLSVDGFAIVARTFGLAYTPGDPGNQDWELCVADAQRIEEFLGGFAVISETAGRRTLVEVLLASFEEALLESEWRPKAWSRFWAILEDELDDHTFALAYWAGIQHSDAPSLGPLVTERLSRLGYSVVKDEYKLVRDSDTTGFNTH